MKTVIALASMVLASSAFASTSLQCDSSTAAVEIQGNQMAFISSAEGKLVGGILTAAGTLGGYDSSDDVQLYRNAAKGLTAQVAGSKVTVFEGNDVIAVLSNCK